MRLLAVIAEKILDFLAPPIHADILAANPLADTEADIETWGDISQCPKCFPDGWEDQLHDAVFDDEPQDPAPRPASAAGSAEPAGTGPLPTVPAGAPLHPAVILSRTLRDVGFAIPAAAAELVALELTHFYNITPKKK